MRVLLADDQGAMRAAMKAFLLHEPDIEFVMVATDGAEAIELSRTGIFDVVVLDVAMPGVNGIVALATIKAEQPTLAVIMFSTRTDAVTVRHCRAKGANGYVAKQSASDDLIPAVHAVYAGEEYYCGVIQGALAA